MSNQFGLMREQRFRPFFFTQFLGAFNDNVFKTALITLITFHASQLTRIDSRTLVTLLPGLFILPFFIFSATSGQLSDKLDKDKVARGVKLFEIGIMCLAAFGFYYHRLWPLVTALFLMGVHSTLFGPVKYSYLPQHLHPDEIIGGNGMVEMGTFVAILLGQVLGAWLIVVHPDGGIAAIGVITVAILGWLASRHIPRTPAGDPALTIDWNPFSSTLHNLKLANTSRTVWLSILGISWFWFYGATVVTQFPNYAKGVLNGSEATFIAMLSIFSIGIGVGSLLCEKLSSGRVEIGLVPFGAIGLTVFGADFYFATPHAMEVGGLTVRLICDLILIGIFGGFYIVPLYALIQIRSAKHLQSRVIAANNIVNAAFMVASAIVSLILLKLGLTIAQLFLATAIFNAIVAIYIYSLVPEFLMRFITWMLVHSIYRLQKRRVSYIPEEGAALLICNHLSFVDPLIIMAACPRPIRFVMDHNIFKLPLLRFAFRDAKAIPIAPAKEDAAALEQAYDEIAAALQAGELVAIFPEGGITRDGELQAFKSGVEKILARTPVPVIPMALQGLWGSFFSRKDGPAMTRPMRRGLFNKITLIVDEPVSPEGLTAEQMQLKVAALLKE
ncbi:MAG TPA: MFS transporter [Steroidobacteraceae bacterium]|nr:MFS transporter [Steroidobacteraceae bacterium]